MKTKWRSITLAVMFTAFTCVALSSGAQATGYGRQDDCNGVLNCNDVEITDESNNNHNRNDNEAEANARANADADARSNADADSRSNSTGVGIGVGMGGSADATGGDADARVGHSGNSRNYVDTTDINVNRTEGGDSDSRSRSQSEGGDAASDSSSDSRSRVLDSGNSRSVSRNDVDASSSNSLSNGADNSSATTVDASDNSSYSQSYKYEEAAKSAAILYGQVCSDVTNIQGVKFGIASSKQSTFCMRVTLAQGFYSAAVMLGCADPVNVAKGAVPVRSPSPSACERDQRKLYVRGTEQLGYASDLVDAKKRGWIHALWNTVVW